MTLRPTHTAARQNDFPAERQTTGDAEPPVAGDAAPPEGLDTAQNYAAASKTVLPRLAQRAAAMASDELAAIERRGLGYMQAGYPLHLRGPAGSGKTTLALRIAEQMRRPIILLVGDASFDTRSLVGGEEVRRTKRVVDRYISSVMKVESQTDSVWLDRALTVACAEGCTLIYDEFNRAPPAANNVLLTVLEERVLVLPKTGRGESYHPVHPAFSAVFTSNPVDHVGTNPAQDALTDRMITLDLDGFARETEIAIVAARSGLAPRESARVVDIVRDFRASREYAQRPTLRASIMIARLTATQKLRVSADDPRFVQVCLDLLASKLKPGEDGLPDVRRRHLLIQLIDHFCAPAPHFAARAGARAQQGAAA